MYRRIPGSFDRYTLKNCDQIVREGVRADNYSGGKQSVFEPSLREDSAVEEKERNLDGEDGGIVRYCRKNI